MIELHCDKFKYIDPYHLIFHLSKLLVDDAKFESVVHLMFIISHY